MFVSKGGGKDAVIWRVLTDKGALEWVAFCF